MTEYRFPTAYGEAQRKLRRHDPQPGDIAVTRESYPTIYDAFETISHDGGWSAGHESYYVPPDWSSDLDSIERQLAAMNPGVRQWQFVLGDRADAEKQIEQNPDLMSADDLLDAFFEDFSNE